MYHAIYPGQVWLDTNGKRIEAHGGTMFFENGTYYWIGEDKSHTRKKGKLWTWGVKLYSSRDLYNWADEGHIIKPEPDDPSSLFHPNRRLDRPHLLKNAKTGKYVLWLKYCDKAHYTVLTADCLKGPYTVEQAFLQPYGHKSGDFDLAQDASTGDAYLYFEADHDKILVSKLRDDYLDVTGEAAVVYEGLKPPFSREAPAHLLRNGKHYLLTSGMTGYVPNPSETATSSCWTGPFSIVGDPHVNDESCASFNSQISHIFPVQGKKDLYIAMADRWVPDYVVTRERYEILMRAIRQHSDKTVKVTFKDMWTLLTSPMMGSADTSTATYVWLPITFEGDAPHICWHEQWRVEDFE